MNIRNPKNTLEKKPILYTWSKRNIICGGNLGEEYDTTHDGSMFADTVDDIKKIKPKPTNDFLDEIVRVFIGTEKIIIVICKVIHDNFNNNVLLANTVHLQILELKGLDDNFIKFIKENNNESICKKYPDITHKERKYTYEQLFDEYVKILLHFYNNLKKYIWRALLFFKIKLYENNNLNQEQNNNLNQVPNKPKYDLDNYIKFSKEIKFVGYKFIEQQGKIQHYLGKYSFFFKWGNPNDFINCIFRIPNNKFIKNPDPTRPVGHIDEFFSSHGFIHHQDLFGHSLQNTDFSIGYCISSRVVDFLVDCYDYTSVKNEENAVRVPFDDNLKAFLRKKKAFVMTQKRKMKKVFLLRTK